MCSNVHMKWMFNAHFALSTASPSSHSFPIPKMICCARTENEYTYIKQSTASNIYERNRFLRCVLPTACAPNLTNIKEDRDTDAVRGEIERRLASLVYRSMAEGLNGRKEDEPRTRGRI